MNFRTNTPADAFRSTSVEKSVENKVENHKNGFNTLLQFQQSVKIKNENGEKMAKKIDRGVFIFENEPRILSSSAVVGSKEGEGPLGEHFDLVVEDAHFGEKTWEKAESRFQLEAVSLAIRKANLTKEQIDVIFSGDLLNQCVGSAYALRELESPYMGIYGACSTMAEGLLMSAVYTESGAAEVSAAVTSSHFSTAERQFRYPLSYGGQRTPTSQWTCTASGAAIVSKNGSGPRICGGCIGKIADMGITDINNMGSAMAPAAAETIRRYMAISGTKPSDFDYIVTGDLGNTGSALLVELLEKQGISINKQHRDCGSMIFDGEKQDTHSGGSGCGCSASVMCGYYLPGLKNGDIRRILFAATGALMSPLTCQQGESIPSISHLVDIKSEVCE